MRLYFLNNNITFPFKRSIKRPQGAGANSAIRKLYIDLQSAPIKCEDLLTCMLTVITTSNIIVNEY